MKRLKFTKQSISPNIYSASLHGYPRRFAELSKASGEKVWSVEIDGVPGKRIACTLWDAKTMVREIAKQIAPLTERARSQP
jgi:hypothetical protein